MARIIIGVMGPGESAQTEDLDAATEIGELIARENWILLTGGRNQGVMHAASKGAREAGGTTIGILPTSDQSGMSEFVDIPIVTGMGSARNNINVLTSDVVIACGTGLGTTSEIVLAIKAGKKVVALNQNESAYGFLADMAGESIQFTGTPAEAVQAVKTLL